MFLREDFPTARATQWALLPMQAPSLRPEMRLLVDLMGLSSGKGMATRCFS